MNENEREGNATSAGSHEQKNCADSGFCCPVCNIDFKSINWAKIVERAKLVLMQPGSFWQTVKSEPEGIKEIYQSYLIVLAAIPAIATFLGMTIVGLKLPLIPAYRWPIIHGFVGSVLQYILSLVMVLVAAVALEKLGPVFECKPKREDCFKLVAYSMFPLYVSGVLNLIPALSVLCILFGIYGIYIFFQGLEPMTGVAAEKKLAFGIAAILAVVIVGMIIGVITMAFQPGIPH